jgi:hypothetical protein
MLMEIEMKSQTGLYHRGGKDVPYVAVSWRWKDVSDKALSWRWNGCPRSGIA